MWVLLLVSSIGMNHVGLSESVVLGFKESAEIDLAHFSLKFATEMEPTAVASETAPAVTRVAGKQPVRLGTVVVAGTAAVSNVAAADSEGVVAGGYDNRATIYTLQPSPPTADVPDDGSAVIRVRGSKPKAIPVAEAASPPSLLSTEPSVSRPAAEAAPAATVEVAAPTHTSDRVEISADQDKIVQSSAGVNSARVVPATPSLLTATAAAVTESAASQLVTAAQSAQVESRAESRVAEPKRREPPKNYWDQAAQAAEEAAQTTTAPSRTVRQAKSDQKGDEGLVVVPAVAVAAASTISPPAPLVIATAAPAPTEALPMPPLETAVRPQVIASPSALALQAEVAPTAPATAATATVPAPSAPLPAAQAMVPIALPTATAEQVGTQAQTVPVAQPVAQQQFGTAQQVPATGAVVSQQPATTGQLIAASTPPGAVPAASAPTAAPPKEGPPLSKPPVYMIVEMLLTVIGVVTIGFNVPNIHKYLSSAFSDRQSRENVR